MLAGVIKVLHNSGLIKSICAEVVYENDLFDYELGTAPKITHKPLIVGDRGKPICVYAIAVTTNDGEFYEIMSMDDIEKCRQVSKAASSPHSPWVKWFDQMAKKTVMHRIAKRLPTNDAINSVVRLDDEASFKEPVNVTLTPDKQTEPLSRLKEAMGMATADVDQAANEVINNLKKRSDALLFHISDYMSHTVHLTPIEDIAYIRCLMIYYLHEKPLLEDIGEVAREIRMPDNIPEVTYVLNKYFTHDVGKGWRLARADEEIQKYKNKMAACSKGGKSAALVNRKSTAAALPLTNNHKPLTNNHKPIKDTLKRPNNVTKNMGGFSYSQKNLKKPLTETALKGIKKK